MPVLAHTGGARRGNGDRGLVAPVNIFTFHTNTLECLGRQFIDKTVTSRWTRKSIFRLACIVLEGPFPGDCARASHGTSKL